MKKPMPELIDRPDMDIEDRLDRLDVFSDAVDAIAAGNDIAKADMEFFKTMFRPAIPNVLPADYPYLRLTQFTGDNPDKTEFYNLVYLVDADLQYVTNDEKVVQVLNAGIDDKNSAAGFFSEAYKAIFLSDKFAGEPWLKAVLFCMSYATRTPFMTGSTKILTAKLFGARKWKFGCMNSS